MQKLKRCVGAVAIVGFALSDTAMAEGILAPGKPANVKNAQEIATDTLLGVGLAAVAIGITIGVSSGSGNTGNSASVSTSTTS